MTSVGGNENKKEIFETGGVWDSLFTGRRTVGGTQ